MADKVIPVPVLLMLRFPGAVEGSHHGFLRRADKLRLDFLVCITRRRSVSTSTGDLAPLMAAVSCADRAAFKQIYDRTSSRLFGIVLRMVRDRPLAEEILQDVYLRIWQRAASCDPACGDPFNWMVAIARHRAIDMMRRHRDVLKEPDADGRDWLEDVAGEADPERMQMDRDGLRKCLGQLEANARECVVLAYSFGYSREELAVRFAAPVNTIKTWLHRGLSALKTCMDAA